MTSSFLRAFWGVRQQMVRRIGPRMQERHGLDLAEHFLLEYVADSDLSPTEIADALSLPAHAISRRLDELEQRGYLTRHIHPEDARKRVLSVTEAGRSAQHAAARTLHEHLAELLSTVDPSALEQCIATLERLGPSATCAAADDTQEIPS